MRGRRKKTIIIPLLNSLLLGSLWCPSQVLCGMTLGIFPSKKK
jgi:hypothetical protein